MNKEKRQKTDKEINIKFVIILVCAFIIGGLGGFASVMLADKLDGDFISRLKELMAIIMPIIFIGSNIGVHIFSFAEYFKGKKLADSWDGWNEEVIDKAEGYLGFALVPENILTVCNFFMYGATLYFANFTAEGGLGNLVIAGIGIVTFIIGLFLSSLLQKLVVDAEKKINPEKRGNVLDMEFTQEWIGSCDEAEKKRIHEAGFKAYQTANAVCMVMTVIATIGLTTFETGLFPLSCVSGIWVSLVVSYSVACIKLEHKK